MKISTTEESPFESVPYFRVREGNKGVEKVSWHFYRAFVDRLPLGTSACLAVSDLQGVEAVLGQGKRAIPGRRLIGFAIAERARAVVESLGIDPKRCGVLLCGDLHSDPLLQRRGGFGDVRDVWMAFRDRFAWCVGVAGNHDEFGSDRDFAAFRATQGIHFLHGNMLDIGGMRIGGVSGVMGRSKTKPWRTPPDQMEAMLKTVLKASPALCLLHEGPSLREKGLDGKDATRQVLESLPPSLILCGHRHWPHNTIAALSNGTRVLNVEGKTVVLLKRQHPGHPGHPGQGSQQ